MKGWGKIIRSRPVRVVLRTGAVLRWTLRVALIVLILDLFYLAVTWPDWHHLAQGATPKSAFMLEYEREHAQHGKPAALRWQPMSLLGIPKHVQRAVIVA